VRNTLVVVEDCSKSVEEEENNIPVVVVDYNKSVVEVDCNKSVVEVDCNKSVEEEESSTPVVVVDCNKSVVVEDCSTLVVVEDYSNLEVVEDCNTPVVMSSKLVEVGENNTLVVGGCSTVANYSCSHNPPLPMVQIGQVKLLQLKPPLQPGLGASPCSGCPSSSLNSTKYCLTKKPLMCWSHQRHAHSTTLHGSLSVPLRCGRRRSPTILGKPKIRDCGTTLESPSFSAQDGSTGKLLRTFEMMAASKPTSRLSPRSHFLYH